jgi:hypothetical protein
VLNAHDGLEHTVEKMYITTDACCHHALANHNLLVHCKGRSMATRQIPVALCHLVVSLLCMHIKQYSHYSKQKAEHDGGAAHVLIASLLSKTSTAQSMYKHASH